MNDGGEDVKKSIPEETLKAFQNDEIRARVFYEKYAMRSINGEVLEKTPEEMWHRIANEIASTEKNPGEWSSRFYSIMEGFKFVPGGRIMFGTGQKVRRVTLLNCYVIPIKEDSIEAIFDWCKQAARTYSYGGGVGGDISVLRPKGAIVHNSALVSTGAVSFMEIMSETTHTIGQQGRRGALMITLDVSHPDIFDFIKVKRDLQSVRYANISVKVSDEFMHAVENDSDFELHFESKEAGNIRKTIKARDLWNELIKSARDWAEPGIIFWDTMKRNSPTEYNGMEIITTNPCSEQPLQAYGACDLGSINLSAFVKNEFTDNASIDWELLKEVVRDAVRFLDDVLEYNMDKHPLKEQADAARNSRRIGLGVTGFADMLCKLKIKYDSNEAIEFTDKLFEFIKNEAYLQSIELAKEKGSFLAFDVDKHLSMPFVKTLNEEIRNGIKKYGLRNSAILTLPPVGSGSVIAGTSSGIEPIFAFSYTRRSESLSQKLFKVYHPLAMKYMEMNNIKDESQLPSFFVAAYSINPEFRVRMQATIQKHVDSAISSTVNLPREATTEEVGKIYMQAWKQGCKGITVYREGSREGILIKEEKPEENQKQENQKQIPKRWERPQLLSGSTVKISVQQGPLYVTANFDESNNIREVFADLGKAGSEEKSYCEAIGRLISKYLQIGGDINDVVKSLEGIRSSYVLWVGDGLRVYSVPDAIAKAIEKILEMRKIGMEAGNFGLQKPLLKTEEIKKSTQPESSQADSANSQASGVKSQTNADPENQPGLSECPICHNDTLVNENGCYICKVCGYTKCE
ncbi:MAG: adenosylcobalamin-dependent ribonucleoside-diphosphate reductase [Candidatus Micrarchaeia archaeon]